MTNVHTGYTDSSGQIVKRVQTSVELGSWNAARTLSPMNIIRGVAWVGSCMQYTYCTDS